jgi:hypothetical protein
MALRRNGADDAQMSAICERLALDETTMTAFANRISPPSPSQQ